MSKVIRKTFMFLSLMVMVAFNTVSAYAAEDFSNEAIRQQQGQESSQKRLVDQQYFVIDNEGNVVEVDSLKSARIGTNNVAIGFLFFDMGDNNYEVQMAAQCLNEGDYFLSSDFYAKPKNNTNWLVSSINHPAYLEETSIGDAIYYGYPVEVSKPTCQVKATVKYNNGSYSIPAHTLKNPA